MSEDNKNSTSLLKKLWDVSRNFISNHWRAVFHFLVLVLLTIYVVCNWKDCITMQFFQDFDGNNILFLIWIILIFFIIYDVEAKGIKIKRRELKQELEQNSMLYNIEARRNAIRSMARNEKGDAEDDG